jgi:exodeoxyribonuclease-3
MTKIATWNVNSLRQRLNHVLQWVDLASPDILLLQETKVTDEQFPRMELEDKGYNLAFTGQKTFNGVAILSKFPLEEIITALPGDESDEQKRYIEALVSTPEGLMRVASAYVPNGQAPDSEKFTYKMNFFDRLARHSQRLLEDDIPLIQGGDYNVAPLPIDVLNPEKLDGSICYHPAEREKLRTLTYLGLTDAFRLHHPHQSEAFSWWDYRAAAFQRNEGYRIDHLLLSAEAADHCTASGIDPTPRGWEKPSDHTPVWAEITLS